MSVIYYYFGDLIKVTIIPSLCGKCLFYTFSGLPSYHMQNANGTFSLHALCMDRFCFLCQFFQNLHFDNQKVSKGSFVSGLLQFFVFLV